MPIWLQDFPAAGVVVELGALLVSEEELEMLLVPGTELDAAPIVEVKLAALLLDELGPSAGVGVFLNAEVMNGTADEYVPSALFR